MFADAHGNVVHLFERDCSIQRRYQKVVEEAPAPGPRRRTCARRWARRRSPRRKAVGYVGAGTVEFIVERRQILFHGDEHAAAGRAPGDRGGDRHRPRRVAAARRRRREIHPHAAGHRAAAATRSRCGFMPRTRSAAFCRRPAPCTGCACRRRRARVETGVREGDAVTPFYDPMIAKIIAWGPDRAAARARLARALAETGVLGVATNLGFLARVDRRPGFRRREARHRLYRAAARRRCCRRRRRRPTRRSRRRRCSASASRRRIAADPWARRDGWRLNAPQARADAGVSRRRREPRGRGDRGRRRLGACRSASGAVSAAARFAPDGVAALTLDGAQSRADRARPRRRHRRVHRRRGLALRAGRSAGAAGRRRRACRAAHARRCRAASCSCWSRPATRCSQGQALIVIEAMKMEHTIAAPRDGTVEAVRYAVGDLVEEGAELIALAEAALMPQGTTRFPAGGPLHLVKMAVGAADVEELRRFRAAALRRARRELGLHPQPSAPRRGGARRRLALLGGQGPDPRAPARHRVSQRARRQRPRLLPDPDRSRVRRDPAARRSGRSRAGAICCRRTCRRTRPAARAAISPRCPTTCSPNCANWG